MKRFVAFLLLFHAAFVALVAQGLEFRSMNYTIDERTSYEVFSSRVPRFSQRLDISFDIVTYPTSRYGYIFRVGNLDDPGRIWNLSYDARGEQIVLRLNDEGHRSAICAQIDRSQMANYKWHRMRVCFDAVQDSLYFSMDTLRFSQAVHFDSDIFRPRLFFGTSAYVVELPSFAVRNLAVCDGSRTFTFPLDESSGTRVHDGRGVAMGKVENPIWQSHDATHWKKVATLSTGSKAGVYYDTAAHEVVLYDSSGLLRYDMGREVKTRSDYASAMPLNILAGTSFLKDSCLYAYELNEWEIPGEGPSVARLNLRTLVWETLSQDRLDGPMHHHAAFLNPVSGKQTFFGGYGDMYFNGSFYTFEPDGSWQKNLVVEEGEALLFPRFFCSAGLSADGRYAYIYGGMGNESGEEVVGRRYFYDLHRYDLLSGECKFLWNTDFGREPCVPARGLVVMDDCFYALCYPEYLTTAPMYLYRFDLSDGSHTRVSSPIEVDSDKVWCYNQLYFDEALGRLVALCVNKDKALVPTVDVYTMLFPPAGDLAQEKGRLPVAVMVLAAILAVAAVALTLLRLMRVRRRRREENDNYLLSKKDPAKKIYTAPKEPDSIHLFGDFAAFDHEGNNISDQFSQQVRTLLLLLVKYSEAGVSPSRLSGILWPDKEPDKARNSRGVAISNLRKAIAPIKGLSLDYADNLYRLEFSEAFHLDLRDFMGCMASGDSDRALGIVSRGRFLKDVHDPVFDSFKSDTERAILPFISQQMKEKYASGQLRATIEIADMAFEYDLLDEQAMRLGVKALLALGRRDDALVRYSVFQSNYRKLSGEQYPVKFENL